MKGMQEKHVEYLRDLLGRRSKRLLAKRDTKSQTEGALCAEIGKQFGLEPEQAEPKPAKAKKPPEDRSHRLAPKPEKRKAVKPAPKPVSVAKPGPVAASPKPAVQRVNDKPVTH